MGADVLSIGNTVIDLYVDCESFFEDENRIVEEIPEEAYKSVENVLSGGRGANQAVAASAAGAEVKYLGKVGSRRDHIDSLERAVDVELEYFEGRTAESYVFSDGSIGFRPPEDQVDESFMDRKYDEIVDSECLMVHNGLEPEATKELLSRMEDEEEKPEVILDPVPLRRIEEVLEHRSVDYITPNEEEYSDRKELFESSEAEVIRTTSEGAYFSDSLYSSPDVPVVDTTGAGDCLNGYLAAGISRENEVEDVLDEAVKAASLSVTRLGAQNPPNREEVERI